MTAAEVVQRIRERFGLDSTAEGRLVTVSAPPEQWVELTTFARDALGCRYFNWLSAIDWKEAGFEVLCRLDDLDARLAVFARTRVPAEAPRCPSLTGLFRGADWMERECYDMFGIVFDGHPDLRRILLDQDWEGYPLRKEYAVDTAHAPYR
jgi:NADH-quinone oxidoreductase subunit C